MTHPDMWITSHKACIVISFILDLMVKDSIRSESYGCHYDSLFVLLGQEHAKNIFFISSMILTLTFIFSQISWNKKKAKIENFSRYHTAFISSYFYWITICLYFFLRKTSIASWTSKQNKFSYFFFLQNKKNLFFFLFLFRTTNVNEAEDYWLFQLWLKRYLRKISSKRKKERKIYRKWKSFLELSRKMFTILEVSILIIFLFSFIIIIIIVMIISSFRECRDQNE